MRLTLEPHNFADKIGADFTDWAFSDNIEGSWYYKPKNIKENYHANEIEKEARRNGFKLIDDETIFAVNWADDAATRTTYERHACEVYKACAEALADAVEGLTLEEFTYDEVKYRVNVRELIKGAYKQDSNVAPDYFGAETAAAALREDNLDISGYVDYVLSEEVESKKVNDIFEGRWRYGVDVDDDEFLHYFNEEIRNKAYEREASRAREKAKASRNHMLANAGRMKAGARVFSY